MRVQLFSFLVMSTLCASSHAGFAKWVDEKGQVHYGDQVPPEYVKKEHTELNEQGVVIKSVKSQEQVEKERHEREAAEAAKNSRLVETKKKELRDRVLLDTFTSERDILIARDDRINAVDSQIALAESNIKEGERKMQELNSRIESIEKSGRKVPDNLFKEKDSVSRQLETNFKYIESKQEERRSIMSRFDEDIKRFRELKGTPVDAPIPAPASSVQAPAPEPAPAKPAGQ